jgi:hypothetical protein
VSIGVRERAPATGVGYVAFCDPSGGSSDSMTLAIAHLEKGVAVLDCVRERKSPFSPESVVAEFADVLKAYHCGSVRGDRYAGEWPRERFGKCGVDYVCADKPKSEIYLAALPAIMSRKLDLLDHTRLISQICGLERTTGRAGKDTIDHRKGARDDLANSVLGVTFLLMRADAGPFVCPPPDLLIVSAPRQHFGDHPGFGLGGDFGGQYTGTSNPAVYGRGAEVTPEMLAQCLNAPQLILGGHIRWQPPAAAKPAPVPRRAPQTSASSAPVDPIEICRSELQRLSRERGCSLTDAEDLIDPGIWQRAQKQFCDQPQRALGGAGWGAGGARTESGLGTSRRVFDIDGFRAVLRAEPQQEAA